MATTSTFLSLRKPDSSDFVSVALDISSNFETLDSKWASSAAADIAAAAAAGSALTVARTDHAHRVASGTVLLPGLPVGESNTGLYRPGTGQLAATIAGVSGWTLTSASLQLEEALSLKKISTPSSPASGYSGLYPKSDENWYRLTSGGTEVAISDATSTTATFARKNRLINGWFPIWQIGTSAPTATDNAYGPDQWRLLIEAASAATLAQETSDTPSGGSHYACKLSIGATNNDKIGIFQIIEGSNMWDMRGGVASLQFQMKVSNARIGDVRAAVVQWTGTENNGGTAFPDPINVWGAAATVPTYTGSWANANTPANLSPTTSWAQYKIENISISASATNLAVFIWIDDKTTTAADYLLVTDVQLEKGSLCTAIERRTAVDEQLACERYCWVERPGNAGVFSGWGFAFSTGAAITFTKFRVPMYRSPTLTPSGAASDYALGEGTTTFTASALPSLSAVTPNHMRVATTTAGVMTNSRPHYLLDNATGNAQLAFLSQI